MKHIETFYRLTEEEKQRLIDSCRVHLFSKTVFADKLDRQPELERELTPRILAVLDELWENIGEEKESLPAAEELLGFLRRMKFEYRKYTYDSGDVYEGEWLNGKRHGTGVYTWKDGGVYEGEWKNDKLNGWGKYTGINGMVYEGECADNRWHGKGQLTFANGSFYEGDFADGYYHGTGTFTNADGTSYVGEWENGKYHGRGTYIFPDGRILEGLWIAGQYQKDVQ